MKKTLLFFSFIIASFIASTVNAQIIFYVTAPPQHVGTHDFTYVDDWGGYDMDTIFVQGQLAFVDDGTADDSLGCNPLVNAADIAGKIAVVYRGACEFGMKALNAQNAGAIGVIIVNNIPGPPVGMGVGAVGAQVTIPVIMISQATGAAFWPEINAGNMTAMIGNKTGVFPNDIGSFKQHIVLPTAWAIPSGIAQNAAQFSVPLGAWVYNYGQNAQSGVTLTATVTLGGSTLYNQTSSAVNLAIGDSAFVSLPVFSQSSYADGLYTITYTLTGSTTDDFPDDNMLTTNFWIQPNYYSKNRWDTLAPMMPIRTSHYRIAGSVPDFMWCTVLDHPNTGNLTAYGVSFSATAANTSSLANKSIELNIYEWNDPVDTSFTFNSLNLLETTYYDYLDNSLSGIFVTAMFDNPVPLQDGVKYLTCVRTPDVDVFLGSDDNLDYETSWDVYNPGTTFDDVSVFFPLRQGTDPNYTWNGVGFGSTPVPAIVLHTQPVMLPASVTNPTTASNVINPYPNPTSEYVQIPLNITYNGKVNVNVFDLSGKLVKTEVVNMNNTNNFRISTANLTNGMYHFNLKFGDDSVANFPVVITR